MKDTHVFAAASRMKIRLSLFTPFFLISCVLAFAAEETADTRKPTPLEVETFADLKKKFPGEFLTADLKNLHELAESAEYKNFLAKAYPEVSLPPAFVEVVDASGTLVDRALYSIPPPQKRYLTYYTEHFQVQTLDDVTDVEHFIVHHEVTETWMHHAMKLGGDKPIYLRTKGPRLSGRGRAKLVQTPQFKEMMKHRFRIEIQGKPNAATAVQMMAVYDFPITRLTRVCLASDARWIQALFEKHGTTDGTLWIALQDPALFSRMRYAFTTAKTFLHFVQTAPDASATF